MTARLPALQPRDSPIRQVSLNLQTSVVKQVSLPYYSSTVLFVT